MRPHRRLLVALFAVVLATLPALGAAALSADAVTAQLPAAACATGSLDQAASTLVDRHALATGTSRIGGLPVGTVVDWRIAPGIDDVLLRVGGRWCGVEAFNAAVSEHLRGATPMQVASVFASVAAMPYLGHVRVSDVAVSGGTVRLTTVGGRHGAESDWTIDVDAAGVRAAAFTTTGWTAQLDGSIGSFEGLTSLPGHRRSFVRGADGGVRIDATFEDLMARTVAERPAALRNAAQVAGLAPGDDLAHTFEDGYTIHVSYGMSPFTPDTGVDTGVNYADRLRSLLAGVVANYGDFVRWGVHDPFDATSRTVLGSESGLPAADGYINVDSPYAPVCLACAYLTEAVEVHVAFFFPELAQPLVGVSYPDNEAFFDGVIGHEMVHSLQGGYSDGSVGRLGSAFVEGSARASEALHDNAANTFQTGSIMYADSSNGCEGFENGRGGWVAAQAAGPFNGHSYDTCYFWLTYYAEHGPEGLTSLLEAIPAAVAVETSDTAGANKALLDAASGDGNGTLDLARWGAAFTAGSAADGYTIPVGQTGESFDWLSLFTPAERAADLGSTQDVTLGRTGAAGFRVVSAATVTQLPEGATAYVFNNVDRQLLPSSVGVGSPLFPGQILVLVGTGEEGASGTLTVG